MYCLLTAGVDEVHELVEENWWFLRLLVAFLGELALQIGFTQIVFRYADMGL